MDEVKSLMRPTRVHVIPHVLIKRDKVAHEIARFVAHIQELARFSVKG